MKNFLGLTRFISAVFLLASIIVVLIGVGYQPAIQQLCWNGVIDDSTAENLVATFQHVYGR